MNRSSNRSVELSNRSITYLHETPLPIKRLLKSRRETRQLSDGIRFHRRPLLNDIHLHVSCVTNNHVTLCNTFRGGHHAIEQILLQLHLRVGDQRCTPRMNLPREWNNSAHSSSVSHFWSNSSRFPAKNAGRMTAACLLLRMNRGRCMSVS